MNTEQKIILFVLFVFSLFFLCINNEVRNNNNIITTILFSIETS